MKIDKIRLLLGLATLLGGGVVVWRIASSSFTSYKWQSNFDRGLAAHDEGSYGEAVSALEQAQFALRDIGGSHPEYDATRDLLADSYEALGRYEDAYALRLESLRRARDLHGPESDEVARALYDLGRLHLLRGESDSAQGFLTESLALEQSLHGNQHPDLIPVLTMLADVQSKSGNFDQAGQYLEWAIGLQRRAVGSENPTLAPLEAKYADVLAALHKDDLAAQFRAHAERLLSNPTTSPSAPAAQPSPVAD